MFLKVLGCLCIFVSFFGVRSQRVWGSPNGGYNSGFSNSWNSNNGFSINNVPTGNGNSAGYWGSNSFGGRPIEKFSPSQSEKNSNSEYEIASNSGKNWNQKKLDEVNNGNSAAWQSYSPKRPNEKKLSPIMNLPESSNWNTNSNAFPSNEDNNLSPWGSNGAKPSSGQSNSENSRPGKWNSNNLNNNAPNENEILTESDYEDNSMYSSYGSTNKKKNKPTSNSLEGSGNRESTTAKNNQNSGLPGNFGTSKWEANANKKPQKTLESNDWGSNDSSGSGREKPPMNTDGQDEKKQSALDTSILDELDRNDWYFGKESDYPKPPFRSTLNIDVSELWNFDKNKRPNQNSRGSNNNSNKSNNSQNGNKNNNNNSNNNKNNNNNSNYNKNNNNNSNNNKNNNNNSNNNKNNINNSNNNKNNNNNRRRNRQIEGVITIKCECVNVNLCEEEDMIVTQEDVKFDLRPLEEFRCEKLTEVCCTNPKMRLSSRANFNEEKEQLLCGERRVGEKPFEGLGENIAAPGEFPWNLKLENGEFNCSATLIHHKMALTAAHCVTGALPNELTLKAGIWNTNDESAQSRKVINIIPHPDYNSRNPRNDIALLILETPFELTDNVNTICMPVTNDKWDSNQCVVAGWSSEEIQGQVLEVLEKGVVNFLPQPECQNIMLVTDLWRNYILHDSFVCGLEKTGRKSCTGDEGGFVICPSKKKLGTYVQIGIVSKGMNCDEFGRPGIFTNVLKFLDWINKIYFELGLFDDIDIRSLTALQ